MNDRRKFENQELINIIEDYKNGMCPKDLGIKYNRNPSSIINRLKNMDIFVSSKNRWTKNEIDYLVIHYPNMDTNEISKYFGRHSCSDIIGKACDLGLHKIVTTWNKEELKILEDNYTFGNISNIVNLFNNKYTYAAIQMKANSLGFTTRDMWSAEEINVLIENYSNKSDEDLLRLLPKRNKCTITVKANSLGLIKENVKYTEAQDLFITNNYIILSDAEIAKKLNRTPSAIGNRRRKLELRKPIKISIYNNISEYIRKRNKKWKLESAKQGGYKCYFTKEKFQAIHHIYGFNLILNDAIDFLDIEAKDVFEDYSQEELDIITNKFIEIQSGYPLGICLREDIHKLFHGCYGYGNNNLEQWNKFKNNFKNGVYDEYLNKVS